jgi:phosphoglycerate dehydrogenase-like enzyme
MTSSTTMRQVLPSEEGVEGAPRDIRSVLATVPYRQDLLSQLRQAFAPAEFIHLRSDDVQGIAKALERVDVAVLQADLDERHLKAPHLKWVHCDHAGLNKSARPEVFERGLIVTGSVGRAAPALAQHILYFVLGLTYDAPGLEEMKRRKAWRTVVDFSNRRGLIEKTMGIIGLGSTGIETAKLAKACGMRVLAYRKSITEAPESVDRLYCADRGETIDAILAESDFVVLCIRLSDATYHMIGRRELAMMKRTAFLINMARGSVVDEPALVAALHDGTIAGAGLDVFEQEPLPPEAPIWDAPNVMITPHATAEVPDLQASSLKIICENIARYRNGRPLLNRLTPADVYSK